MDQIDLNLKAIPLILASKEETRTLWTERNALTPICRLNDDLIVRITEELQDPFTPDDISFHAWVQFSHACTRIRQAITGAPLPWRNVNFTKTSWVALYLRLASTVPIRAYIDGPFDQDLLQSVADNLEQIFILSGDCLGTQSRWLSDFLDTGLPRMQKLEYGDYEDFSVSDALFGGSAHVLTHLDISSSLIDADVPDLPALTTLELHTCWLEHGLPTLFQLLSKAPRITDLTIEYLREQDHGLEPPAFPQVWQPQLLPALSNLLIEDRGGIIQDILARLPDPAESMYLSFHRNPVLDISQIEKLLLRRIVEFSTTHCTRGHAAIIRGYRSPLRISVLDRMRGEDMLRLTCTVTTSAVIYVLGLGELKTVTFSPPSFTTLLLEPEFWGRDVLTQVQKIKFEKADRIVVNEYWKGRLIAWLIERTNRGRRIRTLHLEGQNMDRLDGWIGEIRQSKLVDEVEGILVAEAHQY
jgi:hypothetical protein